MRTRLRHKEAQPPTQHPNADLLTAFVERTLPARERDRLIAHLAECADCREAVALSSSGAAFDSSRKLVRFSPVWTWGIAAAAAAVVCFFALTLPRPSDVPHAPAPPALDALVGSRKTEIPAVPPPPFEQEMESRAARHSVKQPKPKIRLTKPAEQQIAAKQEPAPEQQVVPPATAAVPSNFLAGNAGQLPKVNARSTALAMQTDTTLPRAPALWTVNASGQLQKSLDGGHTWQIVRVTDGDNPLTGAVVKIEATPPAQVRVTTNSGEEWISQNAGASWRLIAH